MRKSYEWEPRPIADLGDLIGYTILLNCAEGSYQGGLRTISYDSIIIEVDEGRMLALDRDVLEDEDIQLFTVKRR